MCVCVFMFQRACLHIPRSKLAVGTPEETSLETGVALTIHCPMCGHRQCMDLGTNVAMVSARLAGLVTLTKRTLPVWVNGRVCVRVCVNARVCAVRVRLGVRT